MDDKIIISNRSALLAKYGSKGLAAIHKALTSLKSADKQRGIDSRVVYLDDAAMIKKLGGKAVSKASNRRENKAAVDAVFGKLKPDYLMILGAHDVVPHQDIANPVFEPEGEDDDRYAWSDLPYACDVTYSRDPARFVGPTRVVGRLPDLVSAREPSYLIALLKTAGAVISEVDFAPLYAVAAMLYDGAWVAERYTVIEDLLKANPDAILPVTRKIIGKAESLTAADAFRGMYRLKELAHNEDLSRYIL